MPPSGLEVVTETLDYSIQQDLHSLRGRKEIRFVADLVSMAEQQLNSGSHLASRTRAGPPDGQRQRPSADGSCVSGCPAVADTAAGA